MGIPGLWAELAPAAQTTTLPSYCLTTFVENRNELRALRLGIDASLWLFHAHQSSGGANPYLRLLFYRLAKLLSLPVLPLFVFDGPSRPTWKRGKQVKGRHHAIEQPFTQLIEAFGFQWHRAPGEAEAELAYLNQAGFVDAVLTDDSDALLFGSQILIRNWGKNLSGTKALSRTTSTSSDVFDEPGSSNLDTVAASATSRLQLSGSDRDHLITLYKASDLTDISRLGLDRDGLILIGLMSGGDYDTTGLLQCGVKIALALARGGFGATLIKAFKASYADQASASATCGVFETFLKAWLEEVREELRSNQRGYLPSRRPKLASTIEESFLSTPESRRVLAYYVYPLTSQSKDKDIIDLMKSKMKVPDLTRLARLSQIYFNWSKDAILSKFRTILGPGMVARRLRQEVLEVTDIDEEGPWAALVESPASKAVRQHALGLDKGTASASTTTQSTDSSAATQKKQRPLHESPNATRITDFFAKAAIDNSARMPTPSVRSHNRSAPLHANSIAILAMKMQRRHAALVPFLDYRVLVGMEEFTQLAEAGIDANLDAELAARRAQNDDSDSEAFADAEEEPAATLKSGTASKRPDPASPLLMWIPEPFLELSASGAAPLKAYLKELEKKAAALRAKEMKKKVATIAKGRQNQTTLTSFVKPVAKPSLTSQQIKTMPKAVPSATKSSLVQVTTESVSGTPRTPRQLRVPSGMQRGLRRTESVPVPVVTAGTNSASFAAPALAPRRGFERHTSLPNVEPAVVPSSDVAADEDWDSSIEFLGAFVSDRRASAGERHSRPTTPSCNTDGQQEERPNKSPRKHRTAAPRSPINGSGTELPRALFRPSYGDDHGDFRGGSEREVEKTGVSSFGAELAKTAQRQAAKPRISSITISDGSSDEDL
ncbi:Holliday junction resolvase YEN1 [Pseudozyma hubeiensis]|nr:Holliday junction resolvase YEN1 [Pseudozyma hubeiensis]